MPVQPLGLSSSPNRKHPDGHHDLGITTAMTTTPKRPQQQASATLPPRTLTLLASAMSTSSTTKPIDLQPQHPSLHSPQPPLSPPSSVRRQQRTNAAAPGGRDPQASEKAIPSHISPYGGGGGLSSRPQSAKSQGSIAASGRWSSRPTSGATTRSVGGGLSHSSPSATSVRSAASATAREYTTVPWGPSHRVPTPSSVLGVSNCTLLTPEYSYQSRDLARGKNKIYARDLPPSSSNALSYSRDDRHDGVSAAHRQRLTELRAQYQEEPRGYDAMGRSEKKLLASYEVPYWVIERVEFARERELLSETAANAGDTLERPRLASWSSVGRLHHCLSVACVVAVQMFVRVQLDLRRKAVLHATRLAKRHQLPLQLSTQALDDAAREMEHRCLLISSSPLPSRQDNDHDDGVSHFEAPLHILSPQPPTTGAPPDGHSNSHQLRSAIVVAGGAALSLSDVMESFSSPRRRQQRRDDAQRRQSQRTKLLTSGALTDSGSGGESGAWVSTSNSLSVVVITGAATSTTTSTHRHYIVEGGSHSRAVPHPPTTGKQQSHAITFEGPGSSSSPREISKARAAYQQRRKSTQAGTVDESIIKENAAFTVHRFFKFAAQVWKARTKRRQLEEYLDEQLLDERVLVVQTFVRCINTQAVLEFKRRLQRRSLAAAVIQRGFRAFRCRVKYLQQLQHLEAYHEERVAMDHVRDACRVLIRALQGMRARSLIRQRQKLLQLKMRYREDAERRQRNQELMELLASLMNSIVRRVKRKNAVRQCNEKRIAREIVQEKKLRVSEAVPLVQTFLLWRKSHQARRAKEQSLIAVLQGHCREKHLVVHRVTTDAIARALSRRVEMITTSFLERCPYLWRMKLRQRAGEVRRRLLARNEGEGQLVVAQSFCRAYLAGRVLRGRLRDVAARAVAALEDKAADTVASNISGGSEVDTLATSLRSNVRFIAK